MLAAKAIVAVRTKSMILHTWGILVKWLRGQVDAWRDNVEGRSPRTGTFHSIDHHTSFDRTPVPDRTPIGTCPSHARYVGDDTRREGGGKWL